MNYLRTNKMITKEQYHFKAVLGVSIAQIILGVMTIGLQFPLMSQYRYRKVTLYLLTKEYALLTWVVIFAGLIVSIIIEHKLF